MSTAGRDLDLGGRSFRELMGLYGRKETASWFENYKRRQTMEHRTKAPPHSETDDDALNRLRATVTTLAETVELLLHERAYGRPPLEATAIAAVTAKPRWIKQTDDGWLEVLTNDSGTKLSLPSGLRADLTKEEAGRDYLKLVEGLYTGAEVNVKSGYLVATDPQKPAVRMTFKKQAAGPVTIGGQVYDKELTIYYRSVASGAEQTKGPFPAKTDPNNPLGSGTYDVEIPDYPHSLGSSYGVLGTVWFRIGHSGDRYVHPGRVSLGCVTCAPGNWPDIYSTIVNARKQDGKSIGTLEVS